MHHFQDIVARNPRILNHGDLVSHIVNHLGAFGLKESVRLGVIVKFRSRIGMRQRYLDGVHIQLLGEIDGAPNGFFGLARQAEDEVAVNDEAEFLAVPGEVPRPFDGRALLNVLEDLLIARLVAHDQQAATGLFHCLQRLVIRSDA